MRLVLAVLCAASFLLGSPALAQGAPRVVTASGPVVGKTADGVSSFKGIPYATPPVGDLRWTAPKPAKPWTADLPATSFGHACMQARPPANVVESGPGMEMSEDCLTLNVWAPASASKAPVIVWIHGGGNVAGTSADKYNGGDGFARDGVVLVSMNYRLGALGFFAQPALGKDANFGLLDQIAALQWVKANIASFGGDPANVTIMGESAGALDVLALMTSPLAKGLFAHAISESAGMGWRGEIPAAEAQKWALDVAKAAGLKGAADAKSLRALPADALAKSGAEEGLDLVLDGRSLTEPLIQSFAAGHAAKVPLLIGTNSGEGSLLGENPKPERVFDELTADDIAKLKGIYGGADDVALARKIFRDWYFAGPALAVAQAHEKAGQDVYLYRFDFRMSVLRSRRPDAYHGSEMPFVFDTLPPQAAGVDDALIRSGMHGCWAAFAAKGAPVCDWAKGWVKGAGTWMVFDDNTSDRPVGSTEAIDLIRSKLAPESH